MEDDDRPVPLAQLRKQANKRKLAEREAVSSDGQAADGSLDDEIKRLEAELNAQDDSDDDASEDDSASAEETNDDESNDSDAAIPSLPAHLLPAPASKRRLKKIKSEALGGGEIPPSTS